MAVTMAGAVAAARRERDFGKPPGSAAPIQHGLARPAAPQPLARGLAADAHLPGDLGDAEAGLYARDEGLAPPRGQFCVRMLGHGRAPLP